jgi:hypothetical protein
MPHFLIILENLNNKWKAEICRIVFPRNYEEGRTISRITFKSSPKSGWTNFINQLFDLKILTLPTDRDIPNFKLRHVMDGCGADIEVATKNVYRYYVYDNPELYKYWQTKNMMKIIKLINDEFEIRKKFKPKHLWPNDYWPKDNLE